MSLFMTSGAPRSLFDPRAAEPERYMSRAECDALYARILALTKGGGETLVTIDSHWRGNLRWASNRIISSGDLRNHTVMITRRIRGAQGGAYTNRLDEVGLRTAVALAETRLLLNREDPDAGRLPPAAAYVERKRFFESSYNLDAAARAQVGRRLVEPVLAKGLLASGYIESGVHARAVRNTTGLNAYHAITNAQYSVTVRNQKGTGSGWAGVDGNDWNAIDANAISQRAVQKCVDSDNPKAIEPGRYTVILEPQAVHDLLYPAIEAITSRPMAEMFTTVYTREPGFSKIGLQLLDGRINISTNPADPEIGYMPFDYSGAPYKATDWFSKGVLQQLSFPRDYAIGQLGEDEPRPNPYSYRMSGGDTTIEQMIASTGRGLLVTRFSDVRVLDGVTLMCSGTTRDGLWLVENGRITHPIKNFRFNESPMFIFNNVESLGVPQRVFGRTAPAIVPPVKAHDFNFTNLADAV